LRNKGAGFRGADRALTRNGVQVPDVFLGPVQAGHLRAFAPGLPNHPVADCSGVDGVGRHRNVRSCRRDQAVVGLGVALWIPVFIGLMSIVQVVSPIIANHFGAGDREAVARDAREGIWLALGAGWATGISMWVAIMALVAWTARAPAYKPYDVWRSWTAPSWAVQKRLLRLGLPMGGAGLAEVAAFSSVAVLVGRFGEVLHVGRRHRLISECKVCCLAPDSAV
jgi:hypothetical protein